MLRCYERHISPAYEKRDTCWQRPAALDGGMVYSETAARRATYRQPIRKRRAVGAVLAIAALAAALGLGLGSHGSSSSSTLSSPSAKRAPSLVPLPLATSAPSDALGESGGALPDATSVFDSDLPGVANLKPALLSALRRAATDAGGAGVEFVVNS